MLKEKNKQVYCFYCLQRTSKVKVYMRTAVSNYKQNMQPSSARPVNPSDTNLDLVGLGIPPVDLMFLIVKCQAVGPAQRCVYHHHSLHPVQVSSLNLWHLAPVSPVHVPETETQNVPFDSEHQ